MRKASIANLLALYSSYWNSPLGFPGVSANYVELDKRKLSEDEINSIISKEIHKRKRNNRKKKRV